MSEKKLVWVAPALTVLAQPDNAMCAQSWNNGNGNTDHPGTGNGGPGNPNKPPKHQG